MKKEEQSFIFEIMAVWRIREKGLWSGTTATSHVNTKVWVALTIFLKTRTLGHFPDKCHGCCTLLKILGGRCSFWSWLLKIRKDLYRVVCVCLIYIYIPYFWLNYIHPPFFFWYILLRIPACLELVFLFFKTVVYLIGFFCFFLLRNQ